jgi:hypothetical protein
VLLPAGIRYRTKVRFVRLVVPQTPNVYNGWVSLRELKMYGR